MKSNVTAIALFYFLCASSYAQSGCGCSRGIASTVGKGSSHSAASTYSSVPMSSQTPRYAVISARPVVQATSVPEYTQTSMTTTPSPYAFTSIGLSNASSCQSGSCVKSSSNGNPTVSSVMLGASANMTSNSRSATNSLPMLAQPLSSASPLSPIMGAPASNPHAGHQH